MLNDLTAVTRRHFSQPPRDSYFTNGLCIPVTVNIVKLAERSFVSLVPLPDVTFQKNTHNLDFLPLLHIMMQVFQMLHPPLLSEGEGRVTPCGHFIRDA